MTIFKETRARVTMKSDSNNLAISDTGLRVRIAAVPRDYEIAAVDVVIHLRPAGEDYRTADPI
ncbi:hypothetical protein [Pelagibacterium lacus]|uniref:Uncharacterized protein n=1 Tax=Pelagibacterium lacus TaxID=2282655 RepID=A0A369VZC4_9HYPH|nr:hypothetical protein [Pelagibacterium lacus]RDE07756.1 hypothetical protein DVH29_15080 [Pelagibacterium lacus]